MLDKKKYHREWRRKARKDPEFLEKDRAHARASYHRNKERYKKERLENIEEAREKERINKRKQRENPEFRDLERLRCKEWSQGKGKTWVREYNRNKIRERRELQKGIEWMYTKDDIKATKLVFPECANCGSNENLEIDHHYPLNKRFGLDLLNATQLCRACNASKSDKLPEDFYSKSKLKDIEFNLAMLEMSES
jgi:hypothetical protein